MFWRSKILLSGLVLSCGCTSGNPDQGAPGPDLEEYLKLSIEERRNPENAAASFEVADGLNIALFASEPMVVNPTNMDVDHRGRIWVLESPNYGKPREQRSDEGGRITILEDTDAR
jgi:hypothetical protein